MRERELKLPHEAVDLGPRRSLPMRERELKRAAIVLNTLGCVSLPMRERELKLPLHEDDFFHRPVAPHAGA